MVVPSTNCFASLQSALIPFVFLRLAVTSASCPASAPTELALRSSSAIRLYALFAEITEASLSPIPFPSLSVIAIIVCVPTTTLSPSETSVFKVSSVSLFSALSSFLALPTTVYSVPLMERVFPSASLSVITFVMVEIVVPTVYPLEPIVMVSPYFNAPITKVAVPVPTPVRVPEIPASCALTLVVEVFPFPFNRYVSLNFVVSATRSISVVS